ncbi:MAG: FecR family protein [Saprospiraceae bacterium]
MSNQDTLYSRWLNGELSTEEEKILRSSGEWAELDAIITAADELTLPAYDMGKAYNAVRRNTKPTKSVVFNPKWAVGIAASFLVMIVTYFSLPHQTKVSAMYAQNQTLQMTDNSTIVLNDGSSITYDESNWEKSRKVNLIGEAAFNVTSGVPFIVNTAHGNVEVLGTSFNVRAWDESIKVECYSGKIKVIHANHESILTVGMGIKISQSAKDEYLVTYTSSQWQSGYSKFRNEKIQNVLKELERQHDIIVNYSGEDLIFSGAFSNTDIIDALNQICKPLGLNYKIDMDNKVVTIT